MPATRDGEHEASVPARRRVPFGGLRIDPVTANEALDRIDHLLASDGGTVFTPNVSHLVRVQADGAFAEAYARCPLQLCDGASLKWAAKQIGEIPARLPGSVFLPRLLEHAARQQWRAFFVGGRPGVTQRARDQFPNRFPGLRVVGYSPPTPMLIQDPKDLLDDAARAVQTLHPDLILVSLPVPLQEIWADATHRRAGGGVFVCTGSAIDLLVGLLRPAPRPVSSCGVEWLWRVVHEPRRLTGRYLHDGLRLAPIVVREWMSHRDRAVAVSSSRSR